VIIVDLIGEICASTYKSKLALEAKSAKGPILGGGFVVFFLLRGPKSQLRET